MKRAYRLAIVHFSIMGLLLILSALLLHGEKAGYTSVSVGAYYLGDAERFMAAKSVQGMLKSVVPHLAAFGLFIMVSAHFFLFAEARHKRAAAGLGVLLFGSGALNLLLPFVIIAGVEAAVTLKLAAWMLFCMASILLLVLLIRIALRGIKPSH